MRNDDPTDLNAQRQREDQKEVSAQLAARQEAEDLKWLMADKRGRRFMNRLLSVTGVNRNPFTGNSETFFKCGEMNVGQRFLGDVMMHCPDRYLEMIKEQSK